MKIYSLLIIHKLYFNISNPICILFIIAYICNFFHDDTAMRDNHFISLEFIISRKIKDKIVSNLDKLPRYIAQI